jgi:hypothetical protein
LNHPFRQVQSLPCSEGQILPLSPELAAKDTAGVW